MQQLNWVKILLELLLFINQILKLELITKNMNIQNNLLLENKNYMYNEKEW